MTVIRSRRKLPVYLTSDEYLTTDEVAEELGYHVESVRRIIRERKLDAEKIKGVWLIRRRSLEAYKQATEGKSKHDPTRGA
jgi:excisionase family DNA binding protein